MPRVTVLMPTYNVAPWVKEAVDSVLAQTFVDFELLIMDDCSTDQTVNIVRSINDERIRLVINEKNLGLSENLNRGLDLISTEYVARMDGDDIAELQWLEKEVAVLDSHPEIGVCSSGFQRFGFQHTVVRFPESPCDVAVNMLFECSVIVPTFRRFLFSELGLRYHTSAFPAEDYMFWAECLRHTQIYNIQETLFFYRMHETQICSSQREFQQIKVREVRKYMLDWLNDKMCEDDIKYYLDKYLSGVIENKEEWLLMHDFSSKILSLNVQKHFLEKSLKNRLRDHEVQSLYSSVVSLFFPQGYSIGSYYRYLRSGLALRTTLYYESKIFVKSLLHRKK